MDRQTQVVVKAIKDSILQYGSDEYIAKAAIAASDAKYVPELVGALKSVRKKAEALAEDYHSLYESEIGVFDHSDGTPYDNLNQACIFADDILAKLPEELKK